MKDKLKKIKSSAALKNSASAMVGNAVNILAKFVAQRVFVQVLGIQFLGLNGILSNVISALNIVELGISSAIIYNLYEPIKKHDVKTVKSLLQFYRKAYNIIALITTVAGIAIMPFLHLIVREPVDGVNMYFAYLLSLLGTVASYLLSYRQSVLYATENGRITTNVQTICNVISLTIQATLLLITQNYYLYLAVAPIMFIVKNVILHIIAGKKYPVIRGKDVTKLDKAIEKDIFKKMRALFIHKVSSFIIFSTDNIIISSFINVATVGLYSNYHMIIAAVETVLTQAIQALTPTVGNVLTDKNTRRNYILFRKIRHISFIIALASSVGILLLSDTVISLWLGKEYTLPTITLLILVLVHFQRLMRLSYSVFKEAAGIFHEDRFVPVIESLINIVVSVVLVLWIGLPGVFIGTFVSSLALWFYSYPKFVYQKLFNRSRKQYYMEMLAYMLIFLIVILIVLHIKEWMGI